VRRKFREAEYEINVKNPNGKQKGVSRIVLDGHPLSGQVIPYSAGKHVVEVEM
jgi:cellobiose phosphorylase